MDNYAELAFALAFLVVGVWYFVNPASAKRFWVRHGASPSTLFGSDPSWIIRWSGALFVVVALFMVVDAITSIIGIGY